VRTGAQTPRGYRKSTQTRPRWPKNTSLTPFSRIDGKFYGILFSYLVNFTVLLTN